MDVRQDSALSDGNSGQELVQLLVVADGELQVARVDPGLLVVTCGVASQLENFGSEVLENSCKIDGGSSTNSLGVVA